MTLRKRQRKYGTNFPVHTYIVTFHFLTHFLIKQESVFIVIIKH